MVTPASLSWPLLLRKAVLVFVLRAGRAGPAVNHCWNADWAVERVSCPRQWLAFYFSDGPYRGLYPWAYLRELDGLGA